MVRTDIEEWSRRRARMRGVLKAEVVDHTRGALRALATWMDIDPKRRDQLSAFIGELTDWNIRLGQVK